MLKQALETANVGKIKEQEPLKKHTTIKIGGAAELFVEPQSIEALQSAMTIINDYAVPWRVIGRGSNLLVTDAGLNGVVIKLGKGINQMSIENDQLRIGAGFPVVPLATLMSKKGYSGFEFAGGIPGSIGGAVYMNAGAHGSDIANIIDKAHILFPDGTLKWMTKDELDYSYRTSILQSNQGICIEAIFRLEPGDATELFTNMQSFKDYRHGTQPYDKPCCGSVFRNPLPDHSGQLIEAAGLKGHQIGGAQVSELHANFIINTGDAKAQDVLDLIEYIQATIKERNGIELQTEVEIVQK